MKRLEWRPPTPRPDNESSGYLGYYTRVHLPVVFDLVDLDGYWPAVWIYRKSKNGEVRVFEEKPGRQMQELHDSEMRVLRESMVFAAHANRYVIWQAERLAIPEFPIWLTKLGRLPSQDQTIGFSKDEFDNWLINEGAKL